MNKLPFSTYIDQTRALIAERRQDSHIPQALEANSPFEYYPDRMPPESGVLFIHGLLDSPFTFRDIAKVLQANGVLCRSVLLPGHGTVPSDLLSVTYQDWLATVRYGVATLKQEVEHIYLMGYSTGASLAAYHALQDEAIDGVVLFAPAIQLTPCVRLFMKGNQWVNQLGISNQWMVREKEEDYAKYASITLNAVLQVDALAQALKTLRHKRSLPMLMLLSQQDETICAQQAINFFLENTHAKSELALYAAEPVDETDARIIVRATPNPESRIENYSHVSLPFTPDNFHYGQTGDYPYASRRADKEVIFGAYNALEAKVFEGLYRLGVVKHKRRELTYNPDFEWMMQKIVEFVGNFE